MVQFRSRRRAFVGPFCRRLCCGARAFRSHWRRPRQAMKTARLTGEVYAANTAGSIVGALAFSLLLIPWLGTKGSQQILIWLAAAGAVFAIAPVAIGLPRTALRFAGSVAAALALAWEFCRDGLRRSLQAPAYGHALCAHSATTWKSQRTCLPRRCSWARRELIRCDCGTRRPAILFT